MKHLLVFRFSSLGDVAMTVPVLRLLLQQHPTLQVTFVSTAFVEPLFENIERLHFVAADLKGRHKGIGGLYRLHRELKKRATFDAIADLHGVLRTALLKFFFAATPKATINKGRAEKKELTRPQNKKLRPLPTTFERYAHVFEQLGFPVTISVADGLSPKPAPPAELEAWKKSNVQVVAIAPFAQYFEKTYPVKKMQEVVRLLLAQTHAAIILLGGKSDREALHTFTGLSPRVHNLAGAFSLREELAFIAHADVVVSMDSANMHLASLYGVPVVSVWGGTHPFLGFMGWGQSLHNAVQMDMDCRPSSVFGSKDCPNRGACLEGIAPIWVYEKIRAVLDAQQNA